METILIVGQDGNPVMINLSDFDETVHTAFDAPLKATDTAKQILDGTIFTAQQIIDGLPAKEPVTAQQIIDSASTFAPVATAVVEQEQIVTGAVVEHVTAQQIIDSASIFAPVATAVVEQEQIVTGAVVEPVTTRAIPTLLVRSNGKTGKAQRFAIVDESSNVIQDDFENETAAWDAILKR